MDKVILATTNQGKIKEFKQLFASLSVEVISVLDLDPLRVPDVEETGQTFIENALLKAEAFYQEFGIPAIADDSGLEVDMLNGEPGIYSARYAGENKSDQANIDKLLHKLEGVPWSERTARFVCAIAYVDGQKTPITAEGYCPGIIALEPKGTGGFGYDPIFYLPEQEQTMAQLSAAEKNRISHRYQALQYFLKKFIAKDID